MALLHIILARLAVFAMLVSALAPAGFMPSWGENGFVISICSPGAAATATITADDPIYAKIAELERRMKSDAPDNDNTHEEAMPDCAFAGAGALALIGDDWPNLTTIFPKVLHSAGRKNLSAFLSETLLPPSTGPPLFSHLS
ncbi:hypothetical protein [Alterisphingorhabdus coralli]|uniref:Uncharacterized protein n=1 Tax=Alterisphingorhabdus coralli TaxID=3071408 RepID=A0AA97F6K2_9SPHN|nr:hypothetical protein [Parasphingorhabdus sp. SCSIO 66989]WOE74391.1 hypothetical protein RB602_11100 [Parasphingorhabdus sp. SCSIO 66989]